MPTYDKFNLAEYVTSVLMKNVIITSVMIITVYIQKYNVLKVSSVFFIISILSIIVYLTLHLLTIYKQTFCCLVYASNSI